MAIEIRELHIKASVEVAGEKKNEATATKPTPGAGEEEGNTEQLIEVCVEKILQILHDKKER